MAAKNVNQKIKQNIRKSTKQSTSATKTPEVRRLPLSVNIYLGFSSYSFSFVKFSLFPVANGKAPQASDITQWQGAASHY